MALFTKKTWKNRMSEYPTRRRLTKENGTTELVTVARSEGTVSQEGDAFSADNMNNLEDRILRAIGTGDIPKELGADIVSAINALNTGISGMLSPIMIVYKDYDVRPTVSNSVVDLNYDISDLILPGYVISQIVDVKVLYTDSLRYQQVTITNLSSQSATAKIMCLNTVPFKIRIYALIYRKSAIAN